MKPDWDTLASEYTDSPTVLIADVDCTASGKSLCEKHGVKGYPTIKTFAAGDTEGTDYDGGRSLEDLRKHAETLGPACSADHKELCSAEQLAQLEKFMAMSAQRREGRLNKLTNAIKLKQAEHDALLKRLQESHSQSQDALEKLKGELQPILKLLKAATPAAA